MLQSVTWPEMSRIVRRRAPLITAECLLSRGEKTIKQPCALPSGLDAGRLYIHLPGR